MADGEVGAIRYAITPLNFSSHAMITLSVNADVENKDSNYNEKFWEEVYKESQMGWAIVTASTKKTMFHVCTGMEYNLESNGKRVTGKVYTNTQAKYADNVVDVELTQDVELVIYKYAAVLSSENHPKEFLVNLCRAKLEEAVKKGFDVLFADHAAIPQRATVARKFHAVPIALSILSMALRLARYVRAARNLALAASTGEKETRAPGRDARAKAVGCE